MDFQLVTFAHSFSHLFLCFQVSIQLVFNYENHNYIQSLNVFFFLMPHFRTLHKGIWPLPQADMYNKYNKVLKLLPEKAWSD